jgi:hypothetical protein
MSAPAVVASIVAIFGAGVVAGIVVGFAWYKGRFERAVRRLDSSSQLDLTGVHHVDTRAKTPVDRPRVRKPTGE